MPFTENGLVPLRYNEIESLIEKTQESTIPQVISYQNSNIIYQLNAVFSRSLDQVSELVEAAFDSLRLSSASGRYLEEIAVLRGVYRLDAQPSSTTKQYAWLNAGAVIPAGSIFSAPNLGDIRATNNSAVSGTPKSCSAVETLTDSTIIADTVYGWSINGTAYSYTSSDGDTVTDIHQALTLLLDADTAKKFTYTEQSSGASRSFTFTADEGTTLTITPLTIRISFVKVKIYFALSLIETGPIEVPAGEMNTLISPSAGFLETANDEDYTLGRDVEKDEELRSRVQTGAASNYAGTPDTIRQGLLANVAGVSFVSVVENLSDNPVDSEGRPWLSYEVLVIGGDDQEVAQEVWRTRPVAERTYGNVANVPVEDSSGQTQFVSYSRPEQVTINVLLQHDTSLSETDFPDGGAAAMQAAIIEYISSLPIGHNIVANRLFGIAYAAIGGRGTVITSIQVEDAANPGYTELVEISSVEFSFADEASVTITDLA